MTKHVDGSHGGRSQGLDERAQKLQADHGLGVAAAAGAIGVDATALGVHVGKHPDCSRDSWATTCPRSRSERGGTALASPPVTTRALTCALLDDGTAKCWGGKMTGQLRLGDTRQRGDQPGYMGETTCP